MVSDINKIHFISYNIAESVSQKFKKNKNSEIILSNPVKASDTLYITTVYFKIPEKCQIRRKFS